MTESLLPNPTRPLAPTSPSELLVEHLVVERTTGSARVRPIDGLSFRAHPGSVTLLLGPSGSGKTTLLSCLAGLLPATAGRVQLGGVDVGGLRGDARVRHRRHAVGVVFQAFNLVPSLDALENVMVPLRAGGASRAVARQRAVAALTRVGLGHRLHHRPGALSGGEQQRVAIARAVAPDPALVLADEPTAHLDAVQVDGVIELLRSLADEGRTLVVATHDQRLLPIAHRLVDLRPAVAP